VGCFRPQSNAFPDGEADLTAKRFWQAEDQTRPATYEPSERSRGGRSTILFRNILIPTDGSDLAAKAVEQGVLFAEEIGAKITAMTVTEPFHLLPVESSQLEYTPIEYQKHSKAHAEKVLCVVSAAGHRQLVASGQLNSCHGQGRNQNLLPAHTADFGPDLECLTHGSSVLGSSDVIATEMEQVVDLIVG
jgi:nucleotide-binding universal stress UspA family protein